MGSEGKNTGSPELVQLCSSPLRGNGRSGPPNLRLERTAPSALPLSRYPLGGMESRERMSKR